MPPLTTAAPALRVIQLPMGKSQHIPNTVQQQDWRYKFDCLIWSNTLQRDVPIILMVRVPSLPALNHLLRDAGLGDWRISHWKLID